MARNASSKAVARKLHQINLNQYKENTMNENLQAQLEAVNEKIAALNESVTSARGELVQAIEADDTEAEIATESRLVGLERVLQRHEAEASGIKAQLLELERKTATEEAIKRSSEACKRLVALLDKVSERKSELATYLHKLKVEASGWNKEYEQARIELHNAFHQSNFLASKEAITLMESRGLDLSIVESNLLINHVCSGYAIQDVRELPAPREVLFEYVLASLLYIGQRGLGQQVMIRQPQGSPNPF
jgi:chromosome segregation ATPase